MLNQRPMPLYAQITKYLRERIEEGHYVPNQQIPTEKELSQLFQVSRITTKRALEELERSGYIYRKRGSGSYVKEREGIGEAGTTARAERISTKQIISMIFPYTMDNGYAGFLKGVSDQLEAKGLYLSVHSSDWNPLKERELLLRLPEEGFDGVILYPYSSIDNMDVVYSLMMREYPLVLIDQYFPNINVGSVVSDNRRGGYLGTEHLIQLGHQKIAYVSSIDLHMRTSVRDRFFGYGQALRDYGLPLDTRLCVFNFYEHVNDENKDTYYQHLIHHLLRRGATAVMAEHDELALDLMRACAKGGILVPEHLSILGFDDIDLAEHHDIPLTTVAQHYYDIGRLAAERITHRVLRTDWKDEKECMKSLVPVTLKRRVSTAPRTEMIYNGGTPIIS